MTTDPRAYLKDAITKALNGETNFPGLQDLAERHLELTQLEKSAWLQLDAWSTGTALLAQHPTYAEYTKSRLANLLHSLED